ARIGAALGGRSLMSWLQQNEGGALRRTGYYGRAVEYPSDFGEIGSLRWLGGKVRDQAELRPVAEPPLDGSTFRAEHSITTGKTLHAAQPRHDLMLSDRQ